MASPVSTTIANSSSGQTLPQATINVASTTGFPTMGALIVQTSSGIQLVSYTGTTATSFTGCADGSGTLSTGGRVVYLTATTTIAPASNGLALPQTTINVASTAGFALNGILAVQTSSGLQIVAYTGTINSGFTGCSGGAGTMSTGLLVCSPPFQLQSSTAIAAGSNGQALPQATINVISTAGFPASGSLSVQTTSGLSVITYTGTTPTSFTGCSGGSGTISTGGLVFGPPYPTIISVANYTELAVIQPFVNSSGSAQVYVEGVVTPGDGGEGTFYWDPNAPVLLDDNTGIVIRSTVPGASGRWRRGGFTRGVNSAGTGYEAAAGPINTKWFGAVGDGVTDDTAAIQAALSAANAIAGAANWVHAPQTPYPAPTQVTVLLPPGRYNVTSTLEMNCYVCLRGDGQAVLQTDSTTIPILRIGAAWSKIEGITFVRGLHAIALYGPSAVYGGFFNPTSFANVPCLIDSCNFIYQAGPAIWQDTAPTTIAAASNGQSLPQSTINVLSTAAFPVPPQGQQYQAYVATSAGLQTIMYTNTAPTALTGCSGGTGTMSTGGAVAGQFYWRTFQTILKVSRFFLEGPSLFWGSGDSVSFVNGHIEWDFTNTPTSGDGYPLGVFNSTDTIYAENVTGVGIGSQPARAAMFVGDALMSIHSCTFAQTDFFCFVRTRAIANTYQGAALAPVPLPFSGVALTLLIDNCDLTNTYGAFWAEVYDQFPQQLRIKNRPNTGADDASQSLGIWVDQGVDLLATIQRHSSLLILDNDSPRFIAWDGQTFMSVFQGFDPGVSAAPSKTQSTDVSSFFTEFALQDRERDMPCDTACQQNIFLGAVVDNTSYLTVNGGTPAQNDTSTGYSLHAYNGGSYWQIIIPSNQLINPNVMQAGVYCFSFYLKTNYAGDMQVTSLPTINPWTTQGMRHFEASGFVFQRICFPFYYPGNNSTWTIALTTNPMPPSVTAWATATSYSLGQRVWNGGNVYLCAKAGTSAASGGPSGTGKNIVDNTVAWNYVSAGTVFTPYTSCGLWMLNAGRRPATYVFPGNGGSFGIVPRIYYGVAPPTYGSYVVGDIVYNTAPTAGGGASPYVGWICTAAGSPGSWKAFGAISS